LSDWLSDSGSRLSPAAGWCGGAPIDRRKEGVLRETGQGPIVTETNRFKFGDNHERSLT
jgi:hypothetical protein